MALVLKIRFDSTDLLISGSATNSPFSTTAWIPKASVNGELVEEILTLHLAADTHDLLAAEIQKLDDLVLRVERYRTNPSYTTEVWFHAKQEGETGERRAFIHALSYRQTDQWDAPSQSVNLHLSILRGGYWEDPTGTNFPSVFTSTAIGTVDYTGGGVGDVSGDVPARLSILAAFNSFVDLDRIWMGIRSADAREQLANFELTWECENGTNEAVAADDTTSETNTASPGSGSGAYVDVTPSVSDTWEKYLTLTLGDVYASDADYDAAFGVFQWLLRHKLGAAGTFQLQLRFGYDDMDDDEFIRRSIIETTNTAWDFTPCGVQQLPLRSPKALGANVVPWDFEGSMAVQIWGKRTSGSGHIYLDCLVPIAVDEGYLFLSGIERGDGDPIAFGVGQSPAGEWAEATYNVSGGNKLMTVGVINQSGFGFPPGDGRIDLVAARATSSVFDADYLNFSTGSEYFERWRSLRGSE